MNAQPARGLVLAPSDIVHLDSHGSVVGQLFVGQWCCRHWLLPISLFPTPAGAGWSPTGMAPGTTGLPELRPAKPVLDLNTRDIQGRRRAARQQRPLARLAVRYGGVGVHLRQESTVEPPLRRGRAAGPWSASWRHSGHLSGLNRAGLLVNRTWGICSPGEILLMSSFFRADDSWAIRALSMISIEAPWGLVPKPVRVR
jgi:hypothetical protein